MPGSNTTGTGTPARSTRAGGVRGGGAGTVASAGWNRNAAFGTRSVDARSAVTISRFAVMPGRSARSVFATSITALYVTTFWTTCGDVRTWRIVPRNVRAGYASTVNVAARPGASAPTSASAMLVSTSIFDRSSPIRNRVGDANDAATDWPISTLRVITVPWIGERIVVYSRLSCALSRTERAW